MPVGCHDDEMPWGRDSDNILETKQLYGQYSLLCGLLLKTMFLLWCLFCVYFWLEIVLKKFLKAANLIWLVVNLIDVSIKISKFYAP